MHLTLSIKPKGCRPSVVAHVLPSNTRRMVHSCTSLPLLLLPSFSSSRSPHFLASLPFPRQFQDAVPKQESLSISSTPALTPASTASSPTITTSAGSNRSSKSFFASSYYDGGINNDIGASSCEEEPEPARTQAHVRLHLAVLFSFAKGSSDAPLL